MSRLWVLALCLVAPTVLADPIALYCARGADYPDAEMRLSASGPHVVRVTFVGFNPSRTRAEWSLRDCLNTAIRLDSSHDILISLWYRERYSPDVQELSKKSLVYRATSRSVEESVAP